MLIPGAYDALSALAAQRQGAKAVYLSGAGMTNANLAVPDIALASLSEFTQVASWVTAAVSIPAIADADTGFGEEWNVVRTVCEYERAGLAGLHLEDQMSPKRCGHLNGKELVPMDHMCGKIRSAISAKRNPEFMIIARTDARGVEGIGSAIDRAKAYVAAGADAIFPEGLSSKEEFQQVRDAISVPLLANMTEFGKTPIIPLSDFQSIGYEMVIYPMTAFRVALKSLLDTYRELLDTGTQAGLLSKMTTRAELYELIEYEKYSDVSF